MDISITTDMLLVKEILLEPDIWERAAEDGIDPDAYFPGYDSMSAWILCEHEGEIIGIILLHTDTSVSLKMHPYLRKPHRAKGREMMKAFYRWFLDNTETHKLTVIIPENQKKVVNFAKKVGFLHEGFNRESFKQDGQYYGQYYLGMTRHMIEDYLDANSEA